MFQFTALPMGLSSGPRILTKVLMLVFATLRCQFGYSCLGYIDDSFYPEDSLHRCQEATLHAVELFIKLGLTRYWLCAALFSPTDRSLFAM